MKKIVKRDTHLPEELPQETAEEIAAFRAVLEGRQPQPTQWLQEVVSYAPERNVSKYSNSRTEPEQLLAAAKEFLDGCGGKELQNAKISFLPRRCKS